MANDRSGRRGAGLGLAAAGLLLLFLAKGFLTPLDAVRAPNPDGAFDAPRAIERLARILGDQRPHPVDSDANDAVRARLVGEIRALGYEPELREDFSCRARGLRVVCAKVENVLFLAGPPLAESGAKAVMVASHYDSVPAGPGAGDDGIGVAASLELAHLYRAAPPARPVLFLITDGEEMGLLGAASFAATDPLRDKVSAVVNLEARGVRGPALMFQTSDPNARDVAAFRAAARPFANSLMTDIYRLMPNDTDLTMLLPLGYDAVNIALTEGVEFYHTPKDNLAALDARSVQHMGDLALAAVAGFAAQGETGEREGRVAFADILSRTLLVVPQAAAGGAIAFALLLALWTFFRSESPSLWRAALVAPFSVALAAGAVHGAQWLIDGLRPEAQWWRAAPLAMAALAYAGAVGGALLALRLVGGAGGPRVLHAAFAWFAALGAGLYFIAPGASILFAPPLLIYAVGVALNPFVASATRFFAALASLAALVLFLPSLALAETGLGFGMAALFAGVGALLAALALPVAAPQGARTALGLGAAAFAAAFGYGVVAPAASAEKPLPLNIQYFVDPAERTAKWLLATPDEKPPAALAALAEFAPQDIEGVGARRLAAPAPYLETRPPELIVESDELDGGARVVRFRMLAHGADQVSVRLPAEAGAAAFSEGGRDFAVAGEGAGVLACIGRDCDGRVFEARLGAGAAQDWIILGVHYGLPFAAGALVSARPDFTTPIQNGDALIVRARIRI